MSLSNVPELLQEAAAGVLGASVGMSGFLLSKVVAVLAAVGAVVVLARGRERVGPFDLRGATPPSRELWVVSLAACVVGAVLSQVRALSWLGGLAVQPGMGIARDVVSEPGATRAVVAGVVASVYWALALTGARAVRALLARRAPARSVTR